jgi:hypothetical protein
MGIWHPMHADHWELIDQARVQAVISAELIARAEASIAASEQLVRLSEDLARVNQTLRWRYDGLGDWLPMRPVHAS